MKTQKLPKIITNKKGIETRVLIYVLGAIALIAAIGIIGAVNKQITELVGQAMDQAKDAIDGGGGSDSDGTTVDCSKIKCGDSTSSMTCSTDCCKWDATAKTCSTK